MVPPLMRLATLGIFSKEECEVRPSRQDWMGWGERFKDIELEKESRERGSQMFLHVLTHLYTGLHPKVLQDFVFLDTKQEHVRKIFR